MPKWIIDEINLVSLDFVPHWKEVDEQGNPTGKFKATIGQLYIDIADCPEELRKQIMDFVIEVMNSKETVEK